MKRFFPGHIQCSFDDCTQKTDSWISAYCYEHRCRFCHRSIKLNLSTVEVSITNYYCQLHTCQLGDCHHASFHTYCMGHQCPYERKIIGKMFHYKFPCLEPKELIADYCRLHTN